MEGEKLIDIGTKILVLITAIATTYTGCKYNDIKTQLEVQNSQLQAQEALLRMNHDSVSFIREHKLKIYDKLYSVMDNPTKEKLELATILAKEMLVDDMFQEKLLQVLLSCPQASQHTKEIASIALKEIDHFEQQQDAVKVAKEKFTNIPTIDPKSYLVDLFYLESTSQHTLDKITAVKNALNNIGYTVRIRKLSNIINARSGYQIHSNQIRYERENKTEMTIAGSLQQTINSAFNTDIELRAVSQSSPGYLSIFIIK
jgi:hypothetical protein